MSDSSEVYKICSEAELREQVTKLFEDKKWETKTLQYAEDPSKKDSFEERPELIPDICLLKTKLFEKKGWETKTLQYAEKPSKEDSFEERPDLIPDIALLNDEQKLIGIVKVEMHESANTNNERLFYCFGRLQQEAEQLIKGLDAQFVMFFINKKAIIYAKENDSYKILHVDKIPAPGEINNLISGKKDASTITRKGKFARFLKSESADQKKEEKSEKNKEPHSVNNENINHKEDENTEENKETQPEINLLIDSLERLIARHQLIVNSQDPLSYSEKLHLLDIYQSEHQHRDGMYWKQAFAYFAAIFSLIILPRTENFHFEDIPQWLFSIAGGLLAIAWVFLVIAYRKRFMSINDAYNRVNQMLPEYYRRGPLYKESETDSFKWFVNLRMTTVVGVIFAILLCILAFIICMYPSIKALIHFLM